MVTIYFSGTGNSEYIAQRFSEKMKAKCHSIEENIDFEHLLARTNVIAVCYPIYGSCVPRIMREFVEKHKRAFRRKKLIIFCTQMMFSGDGARAFTRLLSGCHNHVIYAEHFNMPNNISNFFLFPIREKERIRKVNAANKKLDVVCSNIKKGVIKKRGWSKFAHLLGKMQNSSYPAIEEKQKGSFVADSNCIQCGLCVKHCPMKNLELDEAGVKQKNNCILCYRCVNLCPKKAATVFIHKKPKQQYKGI